MRGWWLVAVLSLANPLLAIDIQTVETDVGRYEVCRLPQQSQAFELSASRMWGVSAVQESDPEKMQLRSFAAESPAKLLAVISVQPTAVWRILQEDLYVASNGQLTIYALPDLNVRRTQDMDPRPRRARFAPVRAVSLTLAATVNSNQSILFLMDLTALLGQPPPFQIRIDNEIMTVRQVDDIRNALVVDRPLPVTHAVGARVSTLMTAVGSIVRRVPNGWYCNGWVWNDSGEKVMAAFFFCCCRSELGKQREIEKVNFRNVPSSVPEEIGGVQAIAKSAAEIPLGSIPVNLILARQATSDGSVQARIRGYGRGMFSGFEDEFTLATDAALTDTAAIRFPRVEGANCSFVLGSEGFHLRIVSFDNRTADIPAPQRFQFSQPHFLLDELRPNPSFQFIDGMAPHAVSVAEFVPPNQPEQAITIHRATEFLMAELGEPGTSIDDFQRRLDEYLEIAAPEFKQVVGRDPAGVPIPFTFVASTRWPEDVAAVRTFSFAVWKEWPRDEILKLLFADAIQEQLRSGRAGNTTRHGTSTEAERLAQQLQQQALEAERQRQEEEARLLSVRREAFARASQRRMRFAMAVCALGLVASALIAKQFRRRRAP